ncbi:hypothetical protein [Clostridium estertheticum]|uniref:hypothetical protein n=1 Tax=Clostridium estertheticum TaxID=238834 RepID=UPI001CF2072B|nr:hypothetical protein [Clostridium estertheticum]MCB2356920.1 hypothetical protein [Clostridium estertheticum]WAG44006.1 hypothetical protein LL065_26060 [Clostridium estertheticum]
MSKTFKIVKVITGYEIVINAGSNKGIKENQRFLVYSTDGEEVFDPDTNEFLGNLEVTKGTGTVTSVQLKMCTIKSDRYSKYTPTDVISDELMCGMTGEEPIKIGDKKRMPFISPQIGDLVKSV